MRIASRYTRHIYVLASIAASGVVAAALFAQERVKIDRGSRVAPPTAVDELSPVELSPAELNGLGADTQRPTPIVAGEPAVAQLLGLQPGRKSVMVTLDPGANRGGLRTFARNRGGIVKYEYDILPNVINLRDVTDADIAELKRMPGVVKVEDDLVAHAHMTRSMNLIRGLQSQITGAGFSADGTGVRVCVIDTGIDSDHIMYSARIDTAAGRDFVNGDNNPEDDNGHGAHVAGTVLGRTGLTVTTCSVAEPFQGVAPNATLIGVKVLDSTGNGTFSNVIAGIDYCANQTASGGRADVINMSLGGGAFAGNCDTDSAAIASNNAVAAGVVVVASAGNDGTTNALGTPACASGVISVAAVYDDTFPNCEWAQSSFNWGICVDNSPVVDQRCCFSNRSSVIDVAAPGCQTSSASITAGGTSVTAICGTSQASPHVAGLAALILGVSPSLTPAQVRQTIRDGAVDRGAAGYDSSYGWGRIDVLNSLALLGPGCSVNGDCDDSDPCTTDVCNAGACSHTPISCGPNQICVGGVCVGEGACCVGQACSIETTPDCSTLGGSFLGDGTTCGSGTAGNPTVYQTSPNATIPDGGGSGNAATSNITVPDSVIIGDVNVDLTIAHTWVGDLTATVSHLGTTVTIIDRPGVPTSTYGCSLDNYSGILLDDEGTGGSIESACLTNLSSPPNYTPNAALSAFDGMDSAGVWTITVYDSVSADGGTLNTWSLHIDAVGNNPCTAGCVTNGDCDDGLFCNGAETCDAGTCVAGTAPNCSDGVACTTDSCNETTDSCDHAANNGACSDGLFCNGSETCNVTLGCQAGTAPNCNDGVACTTDSCNETTDSCNNTPNNGACSDGLFCNGSETCNVTLGCQAGTAPNCNDGVACTDDSCNEATDSCDHAANDVACDDGLFCTGAESCNVTLGCQTGGDPCPGQVCDEGTDSCVACIVNGDCDDGLFCNGAEVCNAGTCQAGAAPNCDDAIACTGDSCNETTDSCDHAPNNAACDDGLFCNGSETCSVTLGCQAGSDPCGGAGCDEVNDVCLGGAQAWIVFASTTTVPGLGSVQNEDIVAYDLDAGTWSWIFDGSDVGVGTLAINGMSVLASGDILLSFTAAGTITGLIGGPSGGSVDDADIVRFTPTSLGANTAGTFNFYFDGSDVGLSTNDEDIDAIGIAPDGRLVISVIGNVSATGASGVDEDLLVFNATNLGSVTSGSFQLYFDGSDVGLASTTSEDVDAAGFTSTGSILLSTLGAFSVSGASGADEDVFEFFPTALGGTTSGTFAMFLDLSTIGIAASADVLAVEIIEP